MKGMCTWTLVGAGLAMLVCAEGVGSQPNDEDPCARFQLPEVMVFPSSAGEVHFPHQLHAEDLEVACEECHHEVNASRLTMPHPEYLEDFWLDCTTCHSERAAPLCPQSCSVCHHPSPVTIADETLSSKVVIHNSCWKCHEIGSGAEASSTCRDCHRESTPIREG